MKLRILCLMMLLSALVPRFSPGQETEKLVHQEADRLAYDDRLKIMRLFGHVKLWQGRSTLVCDHAVYNLETEEADAAGDLKLTNPDGTVVGDKLKVFYKTKIAYVEGHVTLVYVPQKQKGKKTDTSPVTMRSDELVYDWGKKIATSNGNVLMEQSGKKAWGDHAVFQETPQILTMDGKVKLFRPPKDTLLCDHLVYELKIDHADATGHVEGTFLVREKKEKPAKSKPQKAKTGSPTQARPAPKPPSPATPQPSPSPSQTRPRPTGKP